jgi:polyhydroxybutyrate depolymerase
MRRLFLFSIAACLLIVPILLSFNNTFAAKPKPQGFWEFSSSAEPMKKTFMVEGQERIALVYPNSAPVPETGAPLLFVFHGHGGTARASAQKFQLHNLWPEAVVVYMQGLTGVPGITDPEGKKTGWQKDPGTFGDRDIKFVDVALEQLQSEYKTDPNRVYSLGHSNGGRFTNVIWNTRGEKFAAFCSASGQGGMLIQSSIPRSIFIIAGENDPLVPFENQLLSVELARRLLQTDPSQAKTMGFMSSEPGIDGTELATYLHPGGHEFPKKALPLAVKFFQRHTKQ